MHFYDIKIVISSKNPRFENFFVYETQILLNFCVSHTVWQPRIFRQILVQGYEDLPTQHNQRKDIEYTFFRRSNFMKIHENSWKFMNIFKVVQRQKICTTRSNKMR